MGEKDLNEYEYKLDEDSSEEIELPTYSEETEMKKLQDQFGDMKDLDEIYEEANALGEKINQLEKYLTGWSIMGKRYVVMDNTPDALMYIYRKQLDAMKEYYNCLVARHSFFETLELTKPDGVVNPN